MGDRIWREIKPATNYGVAIVRYTGVKIMRNIEAHPGDNVWFEVSVRHGYEIDYILISCESHCKHVEFTETCRNESFAQDKYSHYEYKFVMPDENVRIICIGRAKGKDEDHCESKNTRRILTMEPKTNQQVIIDTFEIPEELAKRLSELLTTQTIRERMLNQNIDNPTKYEQMEKMLIPVVSEIEAIKVKITREFVPQQYRSDEFLWNYDGYEIDGNRVQILK